VNNEAQTDRGEAGPVDLDEKVKQVAAELAQLKINSVKPLFDYVTPVSIDGASSIRVGLTYETMRMKTGRVIVIREKRWELNRYLKVVPDSSGRHDPFGIFVFSGPGIREGQVVAAGAVHTVLNDLLGHIRGLSRHPLLEIAFHLLERFGLVNPYTTNDVAPTLLYLADCPLPKYGVGSVMARSLSPKLTRARPVKFAAGYHYEPRESGEDCSQGSEQEIIERLKALGYVD
jgi:hypothetical protein